MTMTWPMDFSPLPSPVVGCQPAAAAGKDVPKKRASSGGAWPDVYSNRCWLAAVVALESQLLLSLPKPQSAQRGVICVKWPMESSPTAISRGEGDRQEGALQLETLLPYLTNTWLDEMGDSDAVSPSGYRAGASTYEEIRVRFWGFVWLLQLATGTYFSSILAN